MLIRCDIVKVVARRKARKNFKLILYRLERIIIKCVCHKCDWHCDKYIMSTELFMMKDYLKVLLEQMRKCQVLGIKNGSILSTKNPIHRLYLYIKLNLWHYCYSYYVLGGVVTNPKWLMPLGTKYIFAQNIQKLSRVNADFGESFWTMI